MYSQLYSSRKNFEGVILFRGIFEKRRNARKKESENGFVTDPTILKICNQDELNGHWPLVTQLQIKILHMDSEKMRNIPNQ